MYNDFFVNATVYFTGLEENDSYTRNKLQLLASRVDSYLTGSNVTSEGHNERHTATHRGEQVPTSDGEVAPLDDLGHLPRASAAKSAGSGRSS